MRWRAAVIGLTLLLAACGSVGKPTSQGNAPRGSAATPTPLVSPAASASPLPSPVASPSPRPSTAPTPQLPEGFSYSDFSGGSANTGSAVVAVRVGQHDGYDRFVIEFSGAIPGYTVMRQPSPQFTQSPKGTIFLLEGNAGVLVRLYPVTGWTSYSAPTYFHPQFPFLREARQAENYEAVQQWGLGISGTPALRVFTLGSPSRLVVDVTSV